MDRAVSSGGFMTRIIILCAALYAAARADGRTEP